MDVQKIAHLPGALKLGTIIVGALDVGLTADSYHSWVDNEKYFLSIISVALTLSVFLVLSAVFGVFNFTESSKGRQIDVGFNGLMAVLIGIGVTFMAVSLVGVGVGIESSTDRDNKINIHRNKTAAYQHGLQTQAVLPSSNNSEYENEPSSHLIKRICAVAFGFLNALLYGLLCVTVCIYNKNKSYSEVT